MVEISLEDYKKAYRKERGRRGFITHFVVYIIVNTGLIAYILSTTLNTSGFSGP